jgi:hypothetical protein
MKLITNTALTDTELSNLYQSLIELMAEWIDSDVVQTEQNLGFFKDPVNREKSELHLRMANAAFNESYYN